MPAEAALGFPDGCTKLADMALARCRAELRGGRCALCRREGSFPLPADWDGGPGWNVVGRPSVQAILLDRSRDLWAVVTFAGGRWVNGAFPPILCTGRKRAIELALARGRQVGRRKPSPWGRDSDTWMAGGVIVTVAEPAG